MTLLRLNTAVVAAALLLTGCTQQQQSAISSSDWQKNITDSVNEFGKTAQTKLEHTGNWLSTETELSKLQSAVNRAIEDGSVTEKQGSDLRNSLDYIRKLQDRSISSGEGISPAEKAQITAAVERVDSRLSGWIAGSSNPNM